MDPLTVLGYFIFRFNSWKAFKIFKGQVAHLNTEPLDARGVTASLKIFKYNNNLLGSCQRKMS